MKITSKFELLYDVPRIIVERKGHYSSLASLPPPSFNDPSRLLAFPRRDRKAIHLTEYSADLLQRCFALSVLPSFLSVLLPVCHPTLSSNTYATTLCTSHFPAPCLTVTRERRVSERNHPYNCWGRAGTTSSRKRDESRRTLGW